MAERPLRILHLGNVANNAYLNAKLLNAAGFDCDVLAYANYHIMGSPEWEDSDFVAPGIDESRPDWGAIDLRGYTRPPWFAQGPIGDAVAYLEARRTASDSAGRRWQRLEWRRALITGRRWNWLRRLRSITRTPLTAPPAPTSSTDTAADLRAYTAERQWPIEAVTRLFGHYDVVHAYGAEPILPLACGTRPYVAFEHGTLRALPFQPTAEGRLTAAAYQRADAVLITNADNRRAAERLGVTRLRFVPHPVNELVPDPAAVAALRAELTQRMNADFFVFHPSRQHWTRRRDPHLEKGNDRLIDALGSFLRERPRSAAVFVRWGATLDASQARLAEHGVADRVYWIDPIPAPALSRYMQACQVVADQFYLGAFGAITPRAMFLGTPVLLHLDAGTHEWCFPDLPPVLNASTAEEIGALLLRAAADPAWLADVGRQSREWYARYHSNTVVRQILVETYHDVLRPGT